ncbi:unnamed protein product [Chrysoparadoxa australica]
MRAVRLLPLSLTTQLAWGGIAFARTVHMMSAGEGGAGWVASVESCLARAQGDPTAKYLQLATVEDQQPRCRTVVFRGFHEATTSLKFITDSRSNKIPQLGSNSLTEACWYFREAREQFRITGRCEVITQSDSDPNGARQLQWKELSPAAKAQFFGPDPGIPLAEAVVPEEMDEDALKHPSPNFCLCLLHPTDVDHLVIHHPNTPHSTMLHSLLNVLTSNNITVRIACFMNNRPHLERWLTLPLINCADRLVPHSSLLTS